MATQWNGVRQTDSLSPPPSGPPTPAGYCYSPVYVDGANATMHPTSDKAGTITYTTNSIIAGMSYVRVEWWSGTAGDFAPSLLNGDWVTNFDVVGGGNANLTWDEVRICRLDSRTNSLETIVSGTVNQVLNGTAVYTHTLNGAPSAWNSGDKILWMIRLKNTSGTSQTVQYKSSKFLKYPRAVDGLVTPSVIDASPTMLTPTLELAVTPDVIDASPSVIAPRATTIPGAPQTERIVTVPVPPFVLVQTDMPGECPLMVDPLTGGRGAVTLPGGVSLQARVGGMPGQTRFDDMIVPPDGAFYAAIQFVATPDEAYGWLGGEWTVRLNVAGGGNSLWWRTVAIIALDSACNFLQVIAITPVGLMVRLSGIYSATVAGLAVPGAIRGTDRIAVILLFRNTDSVPAWLVWLNDQEIVGPFGPPPVEYFIPGWSDTRRPDVYVPPATRGWSIDKCSNVLLGEYVDDNGDTRPVTLHPVRGDHTTIDAAHPHGEVCRPHLGHFFIDDHGDERVAYLYKPSLGREYEDRARAIVGGPGSEHCPEGDECWSGSMRLPETIVGLFYSDAALCVVPT